MKNKVYHVASLFVLLFVLTSFGLGARAGAVSAPQSGFTVSPAQLSFSVSTDTPTQTQTLQVTNTYESNLQLTAELQSIDEAGARLVPNGPVQADLAQAVSVSSTQFTVAPHATYQLSVQVNNTAQLADGGHYASLVLTQQASAVGHASFQPAIAVSLFIIKNQNIRNNLQLTSQRISHTLFSLPTSVTLTFRNLGNTHVIPRASVGLYSYGSDNLLAKAVINSESLPIFPGKQADFSAKLDTYGHTFLPKRLQLRTVYRTDGSNIQLIKQQTFWYVPAIDLIVGIAIIGLLWLRRRAVVRSCTFLLRRHRKRPVKHQPHKAPSPKKATKTTNNSSLGRVVIATQRAVTEAASRTKVAKHLTAALFPAIIKSSAQQTQKRIAITYIDKPLEAATKPTKPAKKRSTQSVRKQSSKQKQKSATPKNKSKK